MFKVKLDEDGQILSALTAIGEAFRSSGGSTLMLTEHVENGIDAVQDLVKEKKLEKYSGDIDIQIDKPNSRIIVIDNGTGIVDPIWIMEHPLKSRKTGMTHQKGEFGRGLQGFRGFCDNLEYITLREQVSQKEINDLEISQMIRNGKTIGIDGRCISLKLCKDTIETAYKPLSEKEFKRYTHNHTGTIVIFSNWISGFFDELVRDKEKLLERIQHHFRVVLEKNIVRISIMQDGKSEYITPREFSIDGKEMDLYEIKDRKVYDSSGKYEIGQIVFRFYKAAPRYQHRYKSPFLLVGDRPLGNSDLLKLDQLSDKKVLKSPYLTGYVIANFLKPDSLRLSPIPGPQYTAFIIQMRSALDELEPLVDEYESGFRVVDKVQENQKLILQVQSFLKDQNIALKTIEIGKEGELIPGLSGGDKQKERLSSIPGEENEGLITSDGTIKAVILYEKDKYGKPITKKRIKVQVNRNHKNVKDPNEDGRATKEVYIQPELMSEDGRLRKRNFIGPGLDNYRGKFDKNLSKWDASKFLVLINELHPVFEMYEEQHQKSKHRTDVYSPKQKQMIQECYLRHVMQNCAKDFDAEELERTFWDLKYKFFLNN